jgi:hypothetical protein
MIQLGRKVVAMPIGARSRFRGGGRRSTEVTTPVEARARFRGGPDSEAAMPIEARSRFRGDQRRDSELEAAGRSAESYER